MKRVGIDPPHGVAVAEDGVIKSVHTMKDMEEIFTYLLGFRAGLTLNDRLNYKIIIEKPHGVGTRRGHGRSVQIQKRIAASVGMVFAESHAIMAFCNAMGMPAEFRLSNKLVTKVDAETFRRWTGYDGSTSEHGRDAAMLVFDRKEW